MVRETTPSAGKPLGWLRPLGYITAALLAFVGTARLLQRIPRPDEGLIDAKFREFEARADEYTTAYIGSSLVHRHIVPEVIDGHLQAEGVESLSYNFGAPRLSWPEAMRIADRLIADRPASLRTVVIEVHLFVPTARNDGAARYLDWHTLPETYWSIRRTFDEEEPGEKRRSHIESDLRAFGKRAAAIGRLSGAFERLWKPAPDDPRIELDPEAHGYERVEDEPTGAAAGRHRKFRKRIGAYERDVRRARKRGEQTKPMKPYAGTMLARLVDRLRAAGYDVIVLEMPHINQVQIEFPDPVVDGALTMSMYDPVRYPALFDPKLHYDRVHLGDEGAHVLSALLARRLAGVFRRDARD